MSFKTKKMFKLHINQDLNLACKHRVCFQKTPIKYNCTIKLIQLVKMLHIYGPNIKRKKSMSHTSQC